MARLQRHTLLQLALLILSLPVVTQGRIVKVLVNDTSGAIHFSENWLGPAVFDFNGSDPPGVGGPNSSVCAMGDTSLYTVGTGEGFRFSFRGISAQLVLTSRPDHSRFTVTYDSHTYSRDSYSQVVGCGVAWGSPVGSVVQDHVVTCTNNPVNPNVYLELLSILYDDGSDLQPPPPPPTSTSTSSPTSTASEKSTNTAALPPNSPTVGSASDTGSPSAPGGSEASSTSNPTDTITALHPATTNPTGPQGRRVRTSVAAIAGVAVSAALAALLLLFLFKRWRRRMLTRRSLRAVRPLSLTAVPAAFDSTVALVPPAVVSGEKAARETHPSMRLADEDIDRIAARMHDMIHSSVRHRRADSSGTLGSDERDTSLPSYFTSSTR